jgi:hypothetical protein
MFVGACGENIVLFKPYAESRNISKTSPQIDKLLIPGLFRNCESGKFFSVPVRKSKIKHLL